jgi:hypothetical protein
MHGLLGLSRPVNRVAEHLLRWDLHETSAYASRYPEAVTPDDDRGIGGTGVEPV